MRPTTERPLIRCLATFLAIACFGFEIGIEAADGRRLPLIDKGESEMTPVLVRYYQSFIETRDADAFLQNVLARYTEGTLIRLLDSSETDARRAAVLSLGLVGGASANTPVGERMKDDDPVVRNFAENALWGIWSRADTPENNQELTTVRNLLSEEKLDEAMSRVNLLIDKAPRFAEAWNQRAIIHFSRGDWEKSAADCRKVIDLNPYHYGAISGMAQCHLRADQPKQAIEAFRMLVRIQPHNTAALDAIETLERQQRRP
ncbi:tetratricopeptide repeat protein [bacterium]|nr:tetratricopeptide repeat protein [bacterium]